MTYLNSAALFSLIIRKADCHNRKVYDWSNSAVNQVASFLRPTPRMLHLHLQGTYLSDRSTVNTTGVCLASILQRCSRICSETS